MYSSSGSRVVPFSFALAELLLLLPTAAAGELYCCICAAVTTWWSVRRGVCANVPEAGVSPEERAHEFSALNTLLLVR